MVKDEYDGVEADKFCDESYPVLINNFKLQFKVFIIPLQRKIVWFEASRRAIHVCTKDSS